VSFALTLAPAAALVRAAAKPEDIARLVYVSSATMSHRGDRVAFVVSRADVTADAYRRTLWIVRSDGTGLRQLTVGNDDGDPQWSPNDAALAFTGSRGAGHPQIYRLALDGGEARRLTNEAEGASAPRWSHDGSRIMHAAIFVDAARPTHLDERAAGGTLDEAHKHTDIRTTDRLDFEVNGEGETFSRHTHLLVMRADGTGREQLTPLSPWSETAAAWSYDDRNIAFVSLRRPVDPARIESDVYVVASDGGALHRLPLAHAGNGSPAWTHDSRALYVAVTSHDDPAAQPGIDVARLAGGERNVVPENRVLFGDAVLTDMREDGLGCGPLVEPGDGSFVADVSVPGATELERFDRTGHASRLVVRGDEIAECSANDAVTRLAYVASDATHPGEIFTLDLAHGGSRQITHFNAAYLATVFISKPQPFHVRDEAGFDVYAWFLPAQAAPGTRSPTLLEIHGGPGAEFGNSFFQEMQMLAGRGYNVVYADPRGSTGFGYAFSAALSKNWGDPMFADEMAVMDAVVKRPDVDGTRLGVLGGSYGGYATLWTIGHTHRFRAAVAERVVSNMTSSFLACDECSSTSSVYSFGNPWDHQAAAWRQSPIASLPNVTTPLLLLHSDDDTRTPLVDADQWFTLARDAHEPITYVQVPRENHDLNRTGEPIHRIERLHLIADWFAKGLK
jgi:dipeptidyl aminopeptidase/acylaminoacyl peptidase